MLYEHNNHWPKPTFTSTDIIISQEFISDKIMNSKNYSAYFYKSWFLHHQLQQQSNWDFFFFFFSVGANRLWLCLCSLCCAVFIYLLFSIHVPQSVELVKMVLVHIQERTSDDCWSGWKYWVVCVFTFNLSSCHLNNQHNGRLDLFLGIFLYISIYKSNYLLLFLLAYNFILYLVSSDRMGIHGTIFSFHFFVFVFFCFILLILHFSLCISLYM